MQKINLQNLPDDQWLNYYPTIIAKAKRNTGEMQPVKTAELEDFSLEATVQVPITQPVVIPVEVEDTPKPAQKTISALRSDTHSLHDVPSRIDYLIDRYTSQQKITEVIEVNPLTELLLAKETTTFYGENYYIFQGTVLIKIIANPAISTDSILISYK